MKKDNKNTNTDRDQILSKYEKTLETLKNNIKRIRKEKGFKSAESFAEYLGVSLKTVQGWENLDNGRWPDLPMMLNVCDKTGYDLDYFTGRLEEPTHEIQYIHKKTGLSVEAVAKLIKSKDSVMDSPLSDIIIHDHAERLLRVLLLASDEDEIAWIDLDNLPRGLLSAYAEKPLDFSVGIGADVADFIASQELAEIVRDIRSNNANKKNTNNLLVRTRYDVYDQKRIKQSMLTQLDEYGSEIYNSLSDDMHTKEEKERLEGLLIYISKLMNKIRNASFAEWKHGELQKEFDKL